MSHTDTDTDTDTDTLLRLFPAPATSVPLEGCFLTEPFGPTGKPTRPCVYAAFIASLDGRISLPHPRTGKPSVPRATANPHDWRLFQELAARADALITSGQYLRNLARVTKNSFPVSRKPEFAGLLGWRESQGLAPQPAVVIVTASLDLPPLDGLMEADRAVYVATGAPADRRRVAELEAAGVSVLQAGTGARVQGANLVEALTREGLWNIYMIAGGEVLHTLVTDDAVDRLYLTQACRLLGGADFDTLLTGPVLQPARRFKLSALYYDAGDGADVEQMFLVLDRHTD